MPERISWIDFAKGFVMILVVLGHALDEDYALYTCIYIFHMPFFFISAGYLLNLNKWGGSNNFKKFALKLFKRLLVPYYLANILFFPIWFIICYKLEFLTYFGYWDKATPFTAGLAIFIGNGNGVRVLLAQLWFLPALFFAEIIFIKLWNLLNKFDTEVFVIALVFCSYVGINVNPIGTAILNFAKDLFSFDCGLQYVVFPLAIDIALTSLIFLLAGISIRKNELINKMDLKFFVLMLLIVIISFNFNDTKIVNMNSRLYGNTVLFYLGGISGSLLVMKISMLMTKIGGVICDFMNYCGRQSMIILILHPITANIFYEIIAQNTNFLPEEFFTEPIIISTTVTSGVLIPLFIAKKFGKLHVLKYFCS